MVRAADYPAAGFQHFGRTGKRLLSDGFEGALSDQAGGQGLCHRIIDVIFMEHSGCKGNSPALEPAVNGDSAAVSPR